ncbi:MAG: hypothetical protein JO362_15790 [Streptomycetaceae bacterium]|nr:hypothetical protein [Streptomycetaceae bacterium]
MTIDDPWGTVPPAPQLTPWQEYERTLTAAGYGPEARHRYITESADPEYAECEWDNNVIPAAEAAGIIPEPPQPEPTLDEFVHHWAQRAAHREFFDANPAYSPFDRAMTPAEKEQVDRRTDELVRDRGKALAEFLCANERPQWRENDPAAQQASAAYERQVFDLLAAEPKVVAVRYTHPAETTEENK